MPGALAAFLDGSPDGRLHLQHGPIDLVIGVDGGASPSTDEILRRRAFLLAERRFQTILAELVQELPLLKSPAHPDCPWPGGTVARRMMQAVLPFSAEHFITPMAAVAGSVAEEVLAAIIGGFGATATPERIYVNNGGDIAVHLGPGRTFRIGIAREDGAELGAFTLHAEEGAFGIATSGRGGRSLSMGIADSVTVVAGTAAAADAAATIVANAVDLPDHPLVRRAPASAVVDDSDLGDRPVVIGCGPLAAEEIAEALGRGAAMAERLIERGLVHRVALVLGDQIRIVATSPNLSIARSH